MFERSFGAKMADLKDEITRLKSKLKKANSNHEDMVSMWAQQGAEVQREADEANHALGETKEELQALKCQLRKLEQKGQGVSAAEAISVALEEQLRKQESENAQQVEALAAEISCARDELRRARAAAGEVEAELGKAKQDSETAQTRAARLEISLEDALALTKALEARALSAETAQAEGQGLKGEAAARADAAEVRAEGAEGALREAREGEGRSILAASEATVELEACKAELRNVQATLEDQSMEFKISKRRSGQMGKELKEELKKANKAREALEREVKRVERAMLLQAEEALSEQRQQEGRQGAPSPHSGSPGGFHSRSRSSSNSSNSNSSNDTPKCTDGSRDSTSDGTPAAGTAAVATSQRQPQQKRHTTAPSSSSSSSSSSSTPTSSSSSASASKMKIPSTQSEKDLCAELARRLEGLLAENASVRGRVVFLEEEVRDLNEDLDRRRVLCQQLLKPTVSAGAAGGQLFRAAFRSAGGSHADAASTLLDPVAMNARVQALIGAVQDLNPTSSNTNTSQHANFNSGGSNGSSSGSGSDGSARERSGGVAGVGGSEDDGGGGAAATATTPKQRPLLSFSLTPEESLLEITLKENLQLRQRLAFLDPPPRKVGTEDGQGEEEGTRRSGEDDGRGGGGGGDFNGGSESGGGGGVLGKAWLQSPVVSEGLTTFFSRIKEKAADVKESLTSPAPATAAAPPPSAARDAAGTSAGTRIKNDEGDIIP